MLVLGAASTYRNARLHAMWRVLWCGVMCVCLAACMVLMLCTCCLDEEEAKSYACHLFDSSNVRIFMALCVCLHADFGTHAHDSMAVGFATS